MVRAAPGLERQAENQGRVDLGGNRRRQLVRDQDRRRVEVGQHARAARGGGQQVAPEAADDVRHVAAALAQVVVTHFREHVAELVEGAVERPLRVDAIRLDDPARARHQQRVIQHEQLRLEQAGEIGAGPLRHPVVDRPQLRDAGVAGLLQAAQLARPRARR